MEELQVDKLKKAVGQAGELVDQISRIHAVINLGSSDHNMLIKVSNRDREQHVIGIPKKYQEKFHLALQVFLGAN